MLVVADHLERDRGGDRAAREAEEDDSLRRLLVVDALCLRRVFTERLKVSALVVATSREDLESRFVRDDPVRPLVHDSSELHSRCLLEPVNVLDVPAAIAGEREQHLLQLRVVEPTRPSSRMPHSPPCRASRSPAWSISSSSAISPVSSSSLVTSRISSFGHPRSTPPRARSPSARRLLSRPPSRPAARTTTSSRSCRARRSRSAPSSWSDVEPA